MRQRFVPTSAERDAIIMRIQSVRGGADGSLQPKTIAKIISLLHHISQSMQIQLDDITSDDIEAFYSQNNYSVNTRQWANSIFKKYCGKMCNAIDTSAPQSSYATRWLTDDITIEALEKMHIAVINGSADTPCFVAALLILLSCHKPQAVVMLTPDAISQMLIHGGVDHGDHVFAVMPHLSSLRIHGKSLVELLAEFITAPQLSPVFLRNSLISNSRGAPPRGIGFTELYKYSRQKLVEYLENGVFDKSHVQNIIELEKAKFRTTALSFPYLKYLLDGLAESQQVQMIAP